MPNGARSAKPDSLMHPLIGVFDSGVGGLSILREIHSLLPAYPTLFFADQGHLPYGPRPHAELLTFSDGIVRWMQACGVQVIVIACHSASAAALYDLRMRYPQLPFVGIEPAVKPAAENTRSGVIGVLSTQATADGDLYRRTVARYAADVRVLTRVSPDLVTLVERGDWDTPAGMDIIRAHVDPLVTAGADQIALACTHFPFLIDRLREAVGESVTFVDPSMGVARQVGRVLEQQGIAPFEGETFTHAYATSGEPDALRRMLNHLLGIDAPVLKASWQGTDLTIA
ncbi:MAG: glutamate racemase [Anaerolineae bacterium]